MKLFNTNIKKKVFLIAEIGVNHEGSYLKAKKLLDLAYANGADAIKFQFYSPEKFISRDDKKRFKRVKKFSLNNFEINKLIKYSKKKKIPVFATPVSHDYVNFINKNFGIIKIASGDCTFNETLKRAAKTQGKILLSTGNTNINEVKKSINILKRISKINLKKRLVIMHCVSAYPAPIKEINLRILNTIKKFGFYVGYSNHALEYEECCLGAISFGARVIEVHFTDNKKNRKFRDHKLSVSPEELLILRKKIDNLDYALGNSQKKIQESELKQTKNLKKGLVAKLNLDKGTKIKKEHVDYARPALYFNANNLKTILGKKIRKNIKQGYLFRKEHFK